jgi:hypothetical protein
LRLQDAVGAASALKGATRINWSLAGAKNGAENQSTFIRGKGRLSNAPGESARSEPEQIFRRSGQCTLNLIPVDCSGESLPVRASSLEYFNRASVTFRRLSQNTIWLKLLWVELTDCGRQNLDLRLRFILATSDPSSYQLNP